MKKPNILFILSDDQGAWAMHCAGTPELHTPNLDRIAAMGMRFDNFFCASPVCSPARASILTGNIPSAHGVHDWLRGGNVNRQLAQSQTDNSPYGGYQDETQPIQYLAGQRTYTDLLAQNGYSCALSGKWHLGDSMTPQHGFDRWYTIGKGGCSYYHADMVEHRRITMRDGEYVTDLITRRALDFLEELAGEEQPFYLGVHYTAPHAPWNAENHPQKWIDYYDSCTFPSIPDLPDHPDLVTGPVHGLPKRHENLRGYFAAISAMDEGVGMLLDSLEAKGILEDTLVIFTGDNGMSMGHHGVWGKGNGTYPLNLYDTAVKVPFLISYPPMVPKGSLCSEMVSAYDLLPTLEQLLELDCWTASRLPGRSFVPLLCGEPLPQPRAGVVIYDEYGPARMIRTPTHKYIHRYPSGPCELYDLAADPQEERNLADNPAYSGLLLELRHQLEGWFVRYADPSRDGVREDVTGGGQLCAAGLYAQQVRRYAHYADDQP